jgi:hypothetical protein
VGLQFRAEFFNILNHTNFLTPNEVVYTSATSGISPTAGVSHGHFDDYTRQIQFAAKFATPDEMRDASLQFVRKISGCNKPSKANEAAFLKAVDEIARASERLLSQLQTQAPPRNREDEAARARARSLARFGD